MLAASAVLLCGCSSPQPGLKKVNQMSPDEAVAQQLEPFADAVGKHLDGAWKPDVSLTPEQDDATGVPCTLPNGQQGETFSVNWFGPGVADVDSAIATVQAEWKALGIDVKIVNPNDPSLGDARVLSYPDYLTGAAPDGFLLTLTMSAKQTSLEAQTHCIDSTKP